MMIRARLRPALDADIGFARNLYLETMRPVIEELFGWDEEKEVAKFDGQFAAAEVSVIVLDGRDIGWLQVADQPDQLFLKQIYVRPDHQGQGLGTEVMQSLIDRANTLRKPVMLGVVKSNPALALYQRLGFHVTSEDKYKFYMKRPTGA